MTLDHSISRPLEGAQARLLSLGAGVQSSVLALMSARGELPMLDAAFFADTGWEPDTVYAWLDWLETQLPFPLIRVRKEGLDLGDLTLAVALGSRSRSGAGLPPFYVAQADGRASQLPKQCNSDYKRDVVLGAMADWCRDHGIPFDGEPRVEQWIGFSTDELWRLKDPKRKFIHNRWPLVELRMKRHDCISWAQQRQIARPPKSACIFCPYVSNERLRQMRDQEPDDWRELLAFDDTIRAIVPDGQTYVHRSMTPVRLVNLDAPTRDLFDEDCEGYCDV